MQQKPRLSFWQIWNMSFGFMGIQFGWGLQLANMSGIYTYLGANPDDIPILWLAGPVTGLLVQPDRRLDERPDMEPAGPPPPVFPGRRDSRQHRPLLHAGLARALDGRRPALDSGRQHQCLAWSLSAPSSPTSSTQTSAPPDS